MKNLTFVLIAAVVAACTSPKSGEEDTKADLKEVAAAVTLTKAPPSPEYSDASLSLKEKTNSLKDSTYSFNLEFEVAGFELGAQTEGSDTRGIANSGKGQHIHLIKNNGPYSAHYEANVSKEVDGGQPTVVLAFLSRSYHESVKNPNAFFLTTIFPRDLATVNPKEVDLSAQHLFYSRPKGTYTGADTKKLMLDFYLVNTTISPEGNKVRATINGNEFMIDEWAPYYIEGLQLGEVLIKLELLDAEGNLIEGPFNSVERSVTLAE